MLQRLYLYMEIFYLFFGGGFVRNDLSQACVPYTLRQISSMDKTPVHYKILKLLLIYNKCYPLL